MFICPQSQKWYEIHEALKSAWIKSGKRAPRPPVPLILSGWSYSNDVQKKARWEETLNWANRFRFERLIPELAAEDSYFVDEPTDHRINPMGGMMLLEWNAEKRRTQSVEEINQAINKLKENWNNIVGTDLATVTFPIRFTGKRRRRLLVSADSSVNPKWGTWFERSTFRHEREEFTCFRKAVNRAIYPLEVDHIDFQVI